MKVTHTTGPWHPATCRGAVVASHPIPEIGGADDVQHYGGHLVAESIASYNVPIISAAPELLEALELALEYWQHRQQRYKNRAPVWVNKARIAVAKAKGGAA